MVTDVQKVPEIYFGWFLSLVFAKAVLQNDMFCQALGSENDFRVRLDTTNVERQKEYLIMYREKEYLS